jgi:hypothetical protein
MRQGLTWLTGLALGTNGVWMLIRPEIWYYAIPGVTGTGPLNLHFIRDIGCAYLGAAAGLLWMASRPREFWPAALAGGAFLTLHAFVHLWDAVAGRESSRQLLLDLPGVVLPVCLVLGLVWFARRDAREE